MYQRIIPLVSLFLSFIILCLGHGLQSVLIPARATLEHYSEFTIGIMMSAYYAGFIGGTFLCPRLIARVGHIRVFAASAAGASAVMLTYALIPHPLLWIVIRGFYGLCLVHLYTVMESWLNSVSDKGTRGKILSVYMISNFLSMSGGQMLSFSAPAGGFQLFSLSSLLLSLSLLPLILSRIAQPPLVQAPETFGVDRLYRISPLGMAGAMMAGLMGGAYWGLTASFILEMGFAQQHVAWFMAASLVGGLFAQWPLGTLSDRINRRYAILISLALVCLSSCALAAVALSTTPRETFGASWLILWGLLFGAGFHPFYSLCIAHTNDFVSPEHFVRASASLQLVQSSGAFLGPLIAGALMHVVGNKMLFIYIAVLTGGFAVFTFQRLAVNRLPKRFIPFRLFTRTGIMAVNMDPRAAESDA